MSAADAAIVTPDQRVRVFVSSTLGELAPERRAVRRAIERLQLLPVMFELGARPHPPRALYRAYLAQSHVFVGVYWERYGWVAPGEEISGLEDEYRLCGGQPRLVYVKDPAPAREPRLQALLSRIQDDDRASYKHFGSVRELSQLVARDLAVLLSERFGLGDQTRPRPWATPRPNLPQIPTTFVGREPECAELAALMTDQRVVTLVGAGGVGKTRLAVEAARRAAGSFGGRAWLVDLGTVAADRADDGVPGAVVAALGLVDVANQGPISDAAQLIVAALRGAPTLLVLDNCEHVLAAVASLTARIVAECPRAHLVATSRQALRVPGEVEIVTAPLADDAGVQLFADRAAAVRPGFAVTAENRDAVREICRRLDGLPLAIELAAARVKVLPPAEIARRLDDRFRLLNTGLRTAQPRQQTLRALVDWSHDLLSTQERQVFARLGVFVGGIALDAAEAVCATGEVDPLDVLDVVARLVDRSLVVADYDDAGTPRFRMLETLRAYALERLRESGQLDTAQRRHAQYFARFAEEAWAGVRGADQGEWLDRLETEHDNIRAALGWAVARDAAVGQRIAGHVAWFWWLRDHGAEGIRWLRAVLSAPGPVPQPVTARARAMLALLLLEGGEAGAADTVAREAVDEAKEAGEAEAAATAVVIRALVVGRTGGFDEASRLLDVAQAGGDEWLAAVADVVRAQQLYMVDRRALREVADRAVERFTALGDAWGEVIPRMYLGLDAEQRGDMPTAYRHYERGLDIARRLRLGSWEAMFVTHLGSVASLTGDLDRAEALHREAVATYTRVGSPAGVALSRTALAAVAVQRGDVRRARTILEEVLAHYREADIRDGVAATLARLGFLAERSGDAAAARRAHIEGLDVALGLAQPAGVALALEGVAGVAAMQGDWARAARLLGGAASLRDSSGVPCPSTERPDVDRALDRTRAGLGADAFHAAFAAGRQLPEAELVDLARQV